ncbi:uncharacterized protein LOC101852371, partial [Aplysia californica]|uniref:Uncharacterized protein LOC101852371 n=1 Tax=Aplysia californica TaxID=6500 RepID=A0ABM0ZY56_APLCA
MATRTQLSSVFTLAMLTLMSLPSSGQAECNTPVGIADPSLLPDDRIVVSSEAPGHGKEFVRFNCCKGKIGSAWCPDENDPKPSLEIRLPKEVPVGKIEIQAPYTDKTSNDPLIFCPQNFLKSFDLSVKLKGVPGFVSLQKDMVAIANKTIPGVTWSFTPPVNTDVVRIEPREREGLACFRLEIISCEPKSLCSDNWCLHGGECSGPNTCNCTAVDGYYGERCEYTKSTIPSSSYKFVRVDSKLLITEKYNFTYHGQLTLERFGNTNSVVLHPASYIDIKGPQIATCLTDPDSCVSGFSISIVFSVTHLKKNETQIILSSLSLTQPSKGMVLYFHDDKVHCLVGTSSQLWAINSHFVLKDLKWYEMTISWSLGRGLLLLENGVVIGSSLRPTPREQVTLTQPLTIGFKERYTTSLIKVASMKTLLLFWTEAERVGFKREEIPTTIAPTTLPPTTTTAWPEPSCKAKLGMQSGAIKADQISASSSLAGHGTEKARAGCCQGEEDGGWCADPKDTNPWIQVDLDQVTAVSALTFQVPERVSSTVIPSNYVKRVRLEYRDVNSAKLVYKAYSSGMPATPNATVAYLIQLRPRVVTDSVRLYITDAQGMACFWFDLVGCPVTDLCPPNYCENGGQCSGDKKCTCDDDHYGARCQLDKTDIVTKDVGFKEKVNNTITTSDPNVNLTAAGDVTVIKSNSTDVIQLTNGGSVTFPDDECLKDLNKCTSGFTLTLVIDVLTIKDDPLVILTTTGGTPGSQGLTLIYDRLTQKVTFSVRTRHVAWTVTSLLKWQENTWYKVTVTWSPSSGCGLLVDGVLTGSVFGGTYVTTGGSSKPLCLGCGLVSTKVTSTVLIKLITTVHVYISDLTKANVIDVATTPAPPTTTAVSPAPACKTKLGMESGAIKTDQISASSSLPGHGTEKARAGCCKGEEDGGWCADPKDPNPWIQVDLDQVTAVSALSFQVPERVSPTGIPPNYVKRVRLEYRDASTNTTTYKAYSADFPATLNATVAYIIELRPKVVTDSVRIYVTDAHGVACIRFDLIGCDLQDVCPTNYCQNGGQCSGEKTCTCTDDHYGDRCQLDKTEITPQEIGFKDKVNNTITTTDPATNLTATGDVTVIKSNKTNVIEVTNGGYVTFPEDVCLRNLDKCTSGFTLTLVVNCVIIRDDKLLILTSGGEDKGSQGLTLVYNKLTHKLTFTVQTSSVTWKLTTGLKWLENTWYKLTVTWSPAAGCGLVVDGVLTGSVFGGVVTSSGTSSKPLCLGCSYVNTKITSTILIKIISTTHVYIKDLVKADVVDVTSTKDACSAALSDFKFESVTSEKSEVVTSLGTMKSHGDVSIRQEDKDVMLVLDQQGEYVEVSNTGFPCVDDITSCESDLTYRMTFRFLDFLVEPNFIMSSGGDLLNSTGISLYYFHGKINFWVKDGVMVWRAIYDQLLDLQRWYTIDATWSHKGGIELRLDGHLLTNTLNASHKAEPVTEKHPLHLAKSPGANKNKTSLMEILVFRVWRETMDKLQDYHCDELKIKNPVDKCFRNMVDVKFTEVERGHDLLTSLGTMKTYGDVTVEQTMYKQGEMVLVIDEDGEYVDMGTTGIPCLDDITSCNSSFNFRLTFIITKISTQPNYILSSGGELNNATGISLYYFDDKIYFWVKDGTMMHRKFLDRTLEENTWYTLDASWDSNTKKIDVYLDGQEVKGLQFPSSPTPSTMDKYSLLIAKSPEKPSSTRMNILLFRFWEETRTQLVKDGCEKILQVDNPPNPITTPAPTTTPSTTAQLPLHKTQVTFTTIVGNTLVTNYHNMTIHGSVYLEVVPAGNVLVLEKPGSFVDVGKTGIPCLDDIASCNTGFNFRLTCSLTSLTTNPQVLISSGGVGGGNGLTVRYFSQIIYVFVKTSRETYVGTFPCEMRPGFWYTLDVSWSVQTGLGLHVNNLLINGTNLVTSLGSSSTTANTLLLGKSPSGTTTTSLRVYEIDLWTRIYSKLPKQQIVLPSLLPYIITTPGPTTTPEEKLSTTPTALPATTPKHVTRAPINVTDYVWTLSKVTQTTVVSNKQELVVVGGPNHVVNGLILEKADQFLEIPHLKDTCITNPAKCNEGLTIEIDVKLLELAEETIIFTSGGERPDEPGVTLLYRYGYIHVIVSTGSQSWYVSVSRQKIWTNQFCKILVSWSVKTRLQIFVNNVLVGVSESPVPHKEITTSIQDSLIIGGGNTRCVIKEVHIWLVHVEILVETNIIIVQGTPGTPAPTTAASQTPAPTTAAPQTPAPTTTAPVPSVFTSSKPVPTSDFPQCPVGCVPAGPSTAVPSSPQPTTGAPAPTTPAPTQGQTSPPHLPTTNAPAPVPSKPAPTTDAPAPTTPKPAPTTPKPAPTTPK